MKKKLIIVFLTLFLFPLIVNAISLDLSISCDQNQIKVGDSIYCNIYANSDEYIKALEARVILSDGASIVSFDSNKENWWNGSLKSDGVTFNVVGTNSDDGIKGLIGIGSLKIKLNEAKSDKLTIGFDNLSYVDTSYNDLTVGASSGGIELSILNSVQNYGELSELNVNGNNIELKSNVFNYDVTTDNIKNCLIKVKLKDNVNYMIKDSTNGEIACNNFGLYNINIIPKNQNSGYNERIYTINIKSASNVQNEDNSVSNNQQDGVNNSSASNNPQTGSGLVYGVIIMTFLSLAAFLSYYKYRFLNNR